MSKFPDDSRPSTFNIPHDVRRLLKEWSDFNRTSMTAEFVRAVRERAQREQREAVAAA